MGINNKKKIQTLVCVLLACVLCLTHMPANVKAAGNNSIATRINKATTIVINKNDNIKAKCQSIDKKLMTGKAITLKIEGTKNQSMKIWRSVSKKIRKVNKQGIHFQCEFYRTKGVYSYFYISPENAKLYRYTAKFIKKLYSLTRNAALTLDTNVSFVKDYSKYGDYETFAKNVLYDALCAKIKEDTESEGGFVLGMREAEITTSNYTVYDESGISYAEYSDNILTAEEQSTLVVKSVSDCYNPEYPQPVDVVEFKSFEEFEETLKQYPKAINSLFIYLYIGCKDGKEKITYTCKLVTLKEYMPMYLICITENFGDLPCATQLYAIHHSAYFCASDINAEKIAKIQGLKKAFMMPYLQNIQGTGVFPEEWITMRQMYEGKAYGVCMDFAKCEFILFKQLGFTEVYVCSSMIISHSWTIVNVKNSKGKVLWVPFDYGIGPTSKLIVSDSIKKKYLDTEKKRYKFYLGAVKKAPKKKNFTYADLI